MCLMGQSKRDFVIHIEQIKLGSYKSTRELECAAKQLLEISVRSVHTTMGSYWSCCDPHVNHLVDCNLVVLVVVVAVAGVGHVLLEPTTEASDCRELFSALKGNIMDMCVSACGLVQ